MLSSVQCPTVLVRRPIPAFDSSAIGCYENMFQLMRERAKGCVRVWLRSSIARFIHIPSRSIAIQFVRVLSDTSSGDTKQKRILLMCFLFIDTSYCFVHSFRSLSAIQWSEISFYSMPIKCYVEATSNSTGELCVEQGVRFCIRYFSLIRPIRRICLTTEAS